MDSPMKKLFLSEFDDKDKLGTHGTESSWETLVDPMIPDTYFPITITYSYINIKGNYENWWPEF
jgi:hypothetical protein